MAKLIGQCCVVIGCSIHVFSLYVIINSGGTNCTDKVIHLVLTPLNKNYRCIKYTDIFLQCYIPQQSENTRNLILFWIILTLIALINHLEKEHSPNVMKTQKQCCSVGSKFTTCTHFQERPITETLWDLC